MLNSSNNCYQTNGNQQHEYIRVWYTQGSILQIILSCCLLQGVHLATNQIVQDTNKLSEQHRNTTDHTKHHLHQ